MAPAVRVSPSLLACDFTRMAEELRRVEEAGADWHHVDVMDGHFVDNLTIGPPVVAKIKERATIPLDVHLMIEEPARWAARYADAGANVLTFHYEAAEDAFPETIEAFRRTGAKVGVAVNPDCGVKPLRPHLDALDLVLVMSVYAGFGGQKFLPAALDKVRALRDWGFAGDVEIDGGVTGANAGDCIEAGCSVLVAGTFVFRAPDIGQAIQALRTGAGTLQADA